MSPRKLTAGGMSFSGATPAERPDQEAPPPPEPTPIDRRRSSVSLQASKQAVTIDDLLDNRPDPEEDLVTFAVRLPRYLVNALKVHVDLTRPRIRQQEVIKAALLATLPENLVDQARAKAER